MRGTEAPLQSTPHLHFSWKEGDEKRGREGEREKRYVQIFSSARREGSTREGIFQECQELHWQADIPSLKDQEKESDGTCRRGGGGGGEGNEGCSS